MCGVSYIIKQGDIKIWIVLGQAEIFQEHWYDDEAAHGQERWDGFQI